MDAPSRQDVERQLRLVLASAEFEASPKLSELLYYLVTETLAGNSERLKGYTIGVDVFDRQHDFDQGVDAIVRVQMGRLRKLLKSYYDGSGAGDPIRILLVAGRYAPRFELASGEELSDEKLGEPYAAQATFAPPPVLDRAPQGGWLATGKMRLLLAGLALLLIAGIGAATFYLMGHRAGSHADPATEKTRGPLVYVSQYQVIGKDELSAQLAEGLQYDLVNQLAKFPDIAVLGIDTVSGTGSNEALAKPEGADFILGGAIEVNGDEVRITSQLKQTSDGHVIWSDQAKAESIRPKTIVNVQADIAASVASRIGQTYGVISQAMAQQVSTSADPSLEDYRCVLSAYGYMRHKTPETHLKVRTCLEKAVADSPKYATAWALLSWIYGDEERYGFNKVPGEDGRQRSLRAGERAVAADGNSATAFEYLSVARFQLGSDDAGAREAAETALRLSPNDSEVLADTGFTFALLDGDERARQLVLKAIDLNPGHPAWYWGGLAIHALQNGLKPDALKYARLNVSDRGPMEVFLMAGALRLNGQGREADAELASLYRSHPDARDRARTMQVLRMPPKIEALIYGAPRGK
jgi:TolB-like protein/Tfp pilus assembly protein PilF